MDNKIIIVSGLTGAGKSFLYEKILMYSPDISTLIQTTTRPMRDYEIEGVDYYFCNNEEFNSLIKKGMIIGHRIYTTKFNGVDQKCQYGINTLKLLDNKTYIFAGDIRLQRQLKDIYKGNLISIFVDANQDIRRERSKSRGNHCNLEWERRELDDFHLIEEGYRLSDIIFNNNNNELKIKDFNKLINQIAELL